MEEKTRISVKEWRESEGLEDPTEYQDRLADIVMDSVCPAMCLHGCEVEPDGKCEHGNPSLLLALGSI